MTWIVKVISRETDEVVNEIPADTERSAHRVENGLYINLNHDRFYTTCEEVKK
jgi:hypothetical protein